MLFVIKLQASILQLDTLPNYSFLNFEANKILQADSNAMASFFQKLWKYETEKQGKVKILHIGDSHVQGGSWSGTVRGLFHSKLGCGVTERGYVFPYHMAQSNGPRDYKVEYTGNWEGCRSAFVEQNCSWGLAGFNAYSNEDSLSCKIWAKQTENENYQFNQFKLYGEFDTASYHVKIGKGEVSVISHQIDTLSHIHSYQLSKSVDTLSVFFTRKNELTDSIIIQGMYLGNDQSGISYSEAAVNGGKLQSFLASRNFLTQMKDFSPDLLVISLGTNDTYSRMYSDSSFKAQYGFLLYQIKRALPAMNILLTTPGDAQRYMRTHIKENLNTRKIIIELAQKYNCAVWDWFSVMGGAKSIESWKKNKLCAYDKVHLNEKGYRLQGQLMYNALIDAYENSAHVKRKSEVQLNHGVNWNEFLTQFYCYLPTQPLLFNTPVFWLLFLVFFTVYLLVYNRTKIRSWYLLIFSLFFYYKTGGWYFTLLIFSTVADYSLGLLLAKSSRLLHRRFWLSLSILVNLGVLGFFKYSYFLIEALNQWLGTSFQAINVFYWFSNEHLGSTFDITEIILPVGISFYTFQTMSYSIDIYRRKIAPLKNIVDFGFYVSFFPQLVAGPIVRASEFLPQIHKKYELTKAQFTKATVLILGGLIKKVIISDYIAINFVDRIFDAPLRYSGFENLLGVYGYALQIYCDFSAYSDIAIGLALLLGFTLPDNFNAPYLSGNITDFWRRWHMTLSRWLKDYLYISLGGNKKGKFRTLLNIMITMLLGGLWHGASFRFIIWGGLHGMGLVLHKLYLKVFPGLAQSGNMLWRFFSWFITFQFVAFCWVFFRATDMQSYYEMMGQIKSVFYNWNTGEWVSINHYLEVLQASKYVLGLLLFGFAMHWFPKKWELKFESALQKTPLVFYPGMVIVVALILYQFSNAQLSPFIYFQF